MCADNFADNSREAELDIGWKWFEFHAAQRISAFKFFFTIYGAVTAIALTLIDRGYASLAFLAGLAALCVCFLFWSLDKRSRQLTEIGETIIDAQWNLMALSKALNPIQRAAHDRTRGGRFRSVFHRLFVMGCGISLTIILWAAGLLIQQYELYAVAANAFMRLR